MCSTMKMRGLLMIHLKWGQIQEMFDGEKLDERVSNKELCQIFCELLYFQIGILMRNEDLQN